MPYKDKEQGKKNKREYYQKNKVSMLADNKANYESKKPSDWVDKRYTGPQSSEERNKVKREWYGNNRDREVERLKNWRNENREQYLTNRREYDNSPERRVKANKARSKKLKENPCFKLRMRLSIRLHSALTRGQKKGSIINMIGCSIIELKEYIQSKFTEGMTWENWSLDGWHIDHIKPLCSLNLEDPEQQSTACHYTNLQPLWAEDNLKKSGKIL